MLSASAPAKEKAENVRGRVTERWQALIAGDVERAYGFLSPASREVTSLAQYKARVKPEGFRNVKVESVDCQEDVCKVRVILTYDHRLMKAIETPLEESWILDKGRFWYVYRG